MHGRELLVEAMHGNWVVIRGGDGQNWVVGWLVKVREELGLAE